MEFRRAKVLTEFLDDEVDDQLRSVVAYDEDGYELIHLRPDVRAQYSPEAIDQIVEGARLEAFERPLIADAFADDLGDLTCQVKLFDEIVLVNLTLTEAEGVATTLDRPLPHDSESFLDELRAVAERELGRERRHRSRTRDGHEAVPGDSGR